MTARRGVVEQQVSKALEWDGLDDAAEHFLARRADDERPVGTARFRVVDGEGKAERVAVLGETRQGGVGRAVMEALEARAATLGCPGIVLHAQVEALPFYERLGYAAEGPVYEEAGIPHRTMRKPLTPAPTGDTGPS